MWGLIRKQETRQSIIRSTSAGWLPLENGLLGLKSRFYENPNRKQKPLNSHAVFFLLVFNNNTSSTQMAVTFSSQTKHKTLILWFISLTKFLLYHIWFLSGPNFYIILNPSLNIYANLRKQIHSVFSSYSKPLYVAGGTVTKAGPKNLIKEDSELLCCNDLWQWSSILFILQVYSSFNVF